jgi:hypothetical protein
VSLSGTLAIPSQLGADAPVQGLRVGLVLDDVDRADQRAAAEQGRLRALGHFDTLDVEQFDVRAARLGDRHAVLEHRHARLGRGLAAVGGDAAHHEAGVVGRLVLDLEAGHEAGKPVELLHAQLVEHAARIGGQGDRHVERLLFALLGGDEQFLDLIGGRGVRDRLGGLGLAGQAGQAADGGHEQGGADRAHRLSPSNARLEPEPLGAGDVPDTTHP